MMHLGIDFGARLAGTTAVCYNVGEQLKMMQTRKKQDADEFCRQVISELRPDFVMIDAPLSLPAVYTNKLPLGDTATHDFFFRLADRQLRAMSPMFLGGLTARAMQLAAYFAPAGIPFFETWPTAIRRHFGSTERPDPQTLEEFLKKATGHQLVDSGSLSDHGIDSALAWYAGWLKIKGQSVVYGNEEEGLVWC